MSRPTLTIVGETIEAPLLCEDAAIKMWAESEDGMMKWEYMEMWQPDDAINGELDRAGSEGWECFYMVRNDKPGRWVHGETTQSPAGCVSCSTGYMEAGRMGYTAFFKRAVDG